MLKGHTKIELTNVKTGEKKVIEKHNLVTNGVASLYGRLTNDYLLSGDVDLYFGGLLLFEKPIDENVNNYRLPLGNRMIGNGAAGYSPLTPPEFGSYNTDESSLTIENGTVTRKYVYDFSTSKGNGTISAVCLANKYCGFHGAGNANDYADKSFNYLTDIGRIYSSLDYTITNKTNYSIGDYTSVLEYNYSKNVIVLYQTEATGVRLLYMYYPFSKLNPLLQPGTVYKSVLVPYPEKITSEFRTSYCDAFSTPNGSYVIFLKNYQCIQNDKFFIWKVLEDPDGENVYELTNTSNSGFSIQYLNYPENPYYTIVGDYFIFKWANGTSIFKMKLSDPTDIKEIPIVSNFDDNFNARMFLFNYYNKVLISSNRHNEYTTPYSFWYDYTNDTIHRINPHVSFNSENSNNYYRPFWLQGTDDRIAVCMRGGLTNGTKIYRNWFTLSTINNLSEPVEKTSDMTMKVTYTITGKIEEGEE